MKDISNKELGPEGIAAAVDADDELQFSLDGLGGELFSKFTEYKDARDEVTGNWIEDLRAFRAREIDHKYTLVLPEQKFLQPIQGLQIYYSSPGNNSL